MELIFTLGEKRQLHGEVFCWSELDHVDFIGADLRAARFEEVTLLGCDFSGADLRGTEFLRCDLRRSRFEDVQLGGNRFDGSWFTGAVGLSLVERLYVKRLGGCFARLI